MSKARQWANMLSTGVLSHSSPVVWAPRSVRGICFRGIDRDNPVVSRGPPIAGPDGEDGREWEDRTAAE